MLTGGVVAHVSDLHLGSSAAGVEAARQLVSSLRAERVEHVVVTGDVTHRGRPEELALFEQLFAPLLAEGRVTVVPGNHDLVGPGVGGRFMGGRRVDVVQRKGLHLVRVDTTGPHNHSYWESQGLLTREQLDEVERAVDAASPGDAVFVLMHHHPLPLPEESLQERIAARLGWSNAGELELGGALVSRLLGKVDRVLHGHRHRPQSQTLDLSRRALHVSNAGASLELGRVPLVSYGLRAGLASPEPRWLTFTDAPVASPSSARELRTAVGETLRAWWDETWGETVPAAPARIVAMARAG
ncbi:metallophosphoesterase [Aggregicoccus sp. 17bor-14]|uniref:metallophosphoesterase family protein n=1 Tax=Myxococcaceae TaxID=31 RepID=UPI00129CE64E|nr:MULTISPECIES: metallophosphoesterase [Myxococcaceae]MBF5041631.1 metallophosphoesterase [Simulacricoccus sp. 17bor-14]MRI87416.1 metallophosphoesterase [Aggregicoccus sp. 17bor-14]